MTPSLTDIKMPRGALFLAVNIAAVLFAVVFVVTPILAHFADRSKDITENAEQLAHFQSVIAQAKTASKIQRTDDPFLPGNEERVVSADLQANLKSMATNTGVNLLGIRGLQGTGSRSLRFVVVNVELEGSLKAIRDMISAIENQTPLLFVSAASLRSVTEGDGLIRAELKIQGAMRNGQKSPETLLQ